MKFELINLNFFKRKSKHKHELISIGKYYKLYRTEYTNRFDKVLVFERKKCECGYYKDFFVSSNDFLPSLYNEDDDEKIFIKQIKNAGIEEEYEINIRTDMHSNRDVTFCEKE